MEEKQQSKSVQLSVLQHWSLQVFLVFSILPAVFLFSYYLGLGSRVTEILTERKLTETKDIHYKDALFKSIVYFESQRSGHLPESQRVTWRQHSGLTDGLDQGVDLVGGYYDAGDNVKFGFPMAFTVTMLSWSVHEYGDEIMEAGEYGNALKAIKWATDYFLKAHSEPNVLWAQVGEGGNDHECWQRPEDMTTSRQAYKIDSTHPGSDLAGETAAALAAASIVFNTTNHRYSCILLQHAQQLFEFADKFRGKYDDSIKIVKGYYPSSGYKDELLWSALWLYKATKKPYYLKYVMENGNAFGGTTWGMEEFTWDVKHAGIQILVSKLKMEERPKEYAEIFKQYRSKAEHYVCACLQKINTTSIHHTPGGLLYIRKWNNMQHVSNAAFLLSSYADQLKVNNQTVNCQGSQVTPDEINSFAKSQIDYILGSNPMNMSYLVGYGQNYPLRVHHRGASVKVNGGHGECTEGYKKWYKNPGPNPNVIIGALVGGPNKEDQFRDERANFEQTEACTYNTAPLVGLFAKMYALETSTDNDHSFAS